MDTQNGLVTITYTLADGKSIRLEVAPEIAAVLKETDTKVQSMQRQDRRKYSGFYEDGITEGHAFDKQETLADLAERRETCRLLHEAIDRLTAIQRRRIIAYYFRDLNLREIAEVEGTNHTTIAKCIKGALKKLRRFEY